MSQCTCPNPSLEIVVNENGNFLTSRCGICGLRIYIMRCASYEDIVKIYQDFSRLPKDIQQFEIELKKLETDIDNITKQILQLHKSKYTSFNLGKVIKKLGDLKETLNQKI